MTPEELSRKAVDDDLASGPFRAGVIRGHWRILTYEFPTLVVSVAAGSSGSTATFDFLFELSGYNAVAPWVRIWDVAKSQVLPPDRRPQGTERITAAFRAWGQDTVYRPWERFSLAHGEWDKKYPTLAWHPGRTLHFILEDLHALLASI